MDDERVRANHVDRLLRVREAVGPLAFLGDELRCSEVREDERHTMILDDRVCGDEVGLLERRALGSHAHRDADLGRGLREVRVDLFPHAETAGHGGNDQRRLKTLPEEFHAQVDDVQVDFREGVVQEPDVVPVVVLRGDENSIFAKSFGVTVSRRSAFGRRFGSALKRPSTSAAKTARSGRKARASSSMSRSPEQTENPRRRSRTTSPKVTGVKPSEENSKNGVRSIVETPPSSKVKTTEGAMGTAANPARFRASTTRPSSSRTSACTRAAAARFAEVEPPSFRRCRLARMCP